MSQEIKVWAEFPQMIVVHIGNFEHRMELTDAFELHRQLFHATVDAVTNKDGKWAWENPDPQKDPL